MFTAASTQPPPIQPPAQISQSPSAQPCTVSPPTAAQSSQPPPPTQPPAKISQPPSTQSRTVPPPPTAARSQSPPAHRHNASVPEVVPSSAYQTEDSGRPGSPTVSSIPRSEFNCQALAGAEIAANNSSTSMQNQELGGNLHSARRNL